MEYQAWKVEWLAHQKEKERLLALQPNPDPNFTFQMDMFWLSYLRKRIDKDVGIVITPEEEEAIEEVRSRCNKFCDLLLRDGHRGEVQSRAGLG